MWESDAPLSLSSADPFWVWSPHQTTDYDRSLEQYSNDARWGSLEVYFISFRFRWSKFFMKLFFSGIWCSKSNSTTCAPQDNNCCCKSDQVVIHCFENETVKASCVYFQSVPHIQRRVWDDWRQRKAGFLPTWNTITHDQKNKMQCVFFCFVQDLDAGCVRLAHQLLSAIIIKLNSFTSS